MKGQARTISGTAKTLSVVASTGPECPAHERKADEAQASASQETVVENVAPIGTAVEGDTLAFLHQERDAAYRVLLRLATTRRLLTYSELAEALGLKERSALLSFLVTAMEDGVILGKLDSEREALTVQALNPGSSMEAGQFASLQQRLERWEERILHVLAALEEGQRGCARFMERFGAHAEPAMESHMMTDPGLTETAPGAEGILASPVDSDMETEH
ncbi:hypothetical protein CCYA_CCYA04G1394 [Cyanidiococcus yangmingshanensis]|nr:hypothetical protein CCYA_CCYA04G1394 [Cyanidiococcus yangmingshanensis]